MLRPVRLWLAVSLPQSTGSADGAAAALLLVVPAPAPLASRLAERQGGVEAPYSLLGLQADVPLATVVLLVVIKPELSAVVAAADQVPHTARVTVVPAPVPGSVTVSLPLLTGLLRGAAPLTVVVTTSTPLAGRRLQEQGGVSNVLFIYCYYWSRV